MQTWPISALITELKDFGIQCNFDLGILLSISKNLLFYLELNQTGQMLCPFICAPPPCIVACTTATNSRFGSQLPHPLPLLLRPESQDWFSIAPSCSLATPPSRPIPFVEDSKLDNRKAVYQVWRVRSVFQFTNFSL